MERYRLISREWSNIKTRDDLATNKIVQEFLSSPLTRLQLQRVKETFLAGGYIKTRKRMVASYLLFLTLYIIPNADDCKKVYSLVDLLQTKPVCNPRIDRHDRDLVIHFLSTYFEPLIQSQTISDDDEDSLDDSHEADVPKHLRSNLVCAVCKSPAEFVARCCDNILYCNNILCAIWNWNHHSKDKKD